VTPSETGDEGDSDSDANEKTQAKKNGKNSQAGRTDEEDSTIPEPRGPGKARRMNDKKGKNGDTPKEGSQDGVANPATGKINQEPPPTYPPGSSAASASKKRVKQPLRSLFDIRPVFTDTWRYTMNAKPLSLLLVFFCAFSVMGVRQITAIASLPGNGPSDASSLAKRAAGDGLPIDIRYTQKWLDKMFGGTPNPILILTLLFVWVSMSILMSGVIYNAIIEKTENVRITSDEEKKSKWYNNKRGTLRRLWEWIKSCSVAVLRLILMDQYPTVKTSWSKSGLWTLLRTSLFVVQLFVAIVMVRQVLAMASLVAGAEVPIPSTLEIPYTLEILKKALPTMQHFPGGTMLLVASVLTGVLIILPAGWNSLLHPRQKEPGSASAKKTIWRILTCRAFGKGIKLGKWYPVLVGVLGFVLVLSFGACLYYFIEIMAYIGEVGFVKDSGYMDSVGLIGALMIFGIFALPMAWIALKAEDAVKVLLKRRAIRKRKA
jgi:hypothetical protein